MSPVTLGVLRLTCTGALLATDIFAGVYINYTAGGVVLAASSKWKGRFGTDRHLNHIHHRLWGLSNLKQKYGYTQGNYFKHLFMFFFEEGRII